MREQAPFLHFLKSNLVPEMQKRYVISNLTKLQFKILTEIAYNLLAGNIDLGAEDKNQVRKYVKQIRELGKSKSSLKKRKAMLSSQLVKVLIKLVSPMIESLSKVSKVD